MKKEITSCLGDTWVVEEGSVTSNANGLSYALTEPMARILYGSESNKVMAERLRAIESASVDLSGRFFLLQDSKNPLWSHRVPFTNPQFDWVEKAKTMGEFLVFTEDPNLAVEFFISSPEANEKHPGMGDDVFNVMCWDSDVEQYCIAHQAYSLDEAEAWIYGDGDIEELLPPLSYEEVTFMPFASHAGSKKQYKAEIQLITDIEGDKKYQLCEVHIMDQFKQCLSSSLVRAEVLFNLKHDPNFVEEHIQEFAFDDDGTNHLFRMADTYEPETADELKEKLEDLRHNRFIKMETSDKKYELLISWDPVSTYRTTDGKRIHTGEDAPAITKLLPHHGQQLTVGEERAYNIVVKHTEGSMIREVNNLVISPDRLFNLVTSDSHLQTMLRKTKERPLKFADNLKSGDAPCIHQLIAACVQGTASDVMYLSSKTVDVNSLLNPQQKTKTSSPSMDMS
jgi:hypothetical protein